MFGLGIVLKEIFLVYSTQFVFLTIRLVPGNVAMVTINMCEKSPVMEEWIYGITWKHVYSNISVLLILDTTSILKSVFPTAYCFCLDVLDLFICFIYWFIYLFIHLFIPFVLTVILIFVILVVGVINTFLVCVIILVVNIMFRFSILVLVCMTYFTVNSVDKCYKF